MMAAQDHADGRRPARQPGAAALGDRARGAARPRAAARATRARGARCRARWTARGRSWSPSSPSCCRDYPKLAKTNNRIHLGTLGTGNHFIEVCLDEAGRRVVHAALGLARRRQRDRHDVHRAGQAGCAAPQRQPARPRPGVLRGRQPHFGDYVRAVGWAQQLRGAEPRGDDASRDRGREDGDPQELPKPRRGGELPPQLRAAGSATSARTSTSRARAR